MEINMKKRLHSPTAISRVRESALFRYISYKCTRALQAQDMNKIKQKTSNKKRVELRTRRASLTIEASIVIPLFLFFAITFMSFINLTHKELTSQTELDNKVRNMSRYASVTNLSKDVFLSNSYEWKFPYFPGDVFNIKVYQHCKSRAWIGARIKDSTNEQIVYVTETGSVYHKIPTCSHIKLSIETTSYSGVKEKRNAYGGKYSPCEMCGKNAKYSSVLYITRTGDRYHTSISCSGLKRSVKGVKISQVSSLGKCSRCWAD